MKRISAISQWKHLSEFYPQDGDESQLALKLRHRHPMYITGHHRTLTMSEIHKKLKPKTLDRKIQNISKYLNDKLILLCLLQFSLEVAQNSQRIPWLFHVPRNSWVFQVFQVCGHPGYVVTLQSVNRDQCNSRTNHPAWLAPATDNRRFLQVDRIGFGSADRFTSATQNTTRYDTIR